MRQEQAAHAAHLEQVLAHFGQVQKVEELQKNALTVAAAAVMASAHLVTAPQLVTSVSGSHASTKINKPPVLPHFSRADPIPKDEGSYEQWRFQVVGAQKVCTEEAVHSAIVCSVQGEVREMISFLGLDVNISESLCHGILMSMHRASQITSEKLATLDCNCFIKSTMN